jgi:hypothetical protein
MAADQQKLIAYGKVLEDDNKSLKDYSIKEGDFLVVMVSKVCLSIIKFTNSQNPQLSQRKMQKWMSKFSNRIHQLNLNQQHHNHKHQLKFSPQYKLNQVRQLPVCLLKWK